MMLEFPQEPCQALAAALDALTMQLSARVPLYQDAAGTWLVPLHPLLDTVALPPLFEATALMLLHPQSYTLAQGTTVLMVSLGEAFALLPFSRHFPEALPHVLQIVAERPAAGTGPGVSPPAPARLRPRRGGHRPAPEG
jgi:hypothetical protein